MFAFQDPTNLNGKVQKHQNFEQELNANKSRMEEITSTGQELVEARNFATREWNIYDLTSSNFGCRAVQ